VSSLAGAERITFLAPPLKCYSADSFDKKAPVASTTMEA